MRRMPPYYNRNRRYMYGVLVNRRNPRAFYGNQGYRQGYRPTQCCSNNSNNSNNGNNGNNGNTGKGNHCPSAVEYIGNMFLLGLTTLVGELVDLQAANALNVLLQPFQNEESGGVEQDVLATVLQDADVVDLLQGLL